MMGADCSGATNLYELFANQAACSPEAIAIVGETETTFGELRARAEAVSGFLQARDTMPEEPIGVAMQRSPDMVATLLGVLRSGASYVPCDPDQPAPRIQRMFSNARCRLILSDALTAPALAGPMQVQPVEAIGPADTNLAQCAPGGERRAYTMFTSGSTGEAKGVDVEHSSLMNLLLAARDLINFRSTDRYLATSTIGFDISVAELFIPLITGGSMLLRDGSILVEPGRLATEISEHGVTVVQTGPSVWDLALRQGHLPKIRVAISTGEAIAPGLASRLARHADQAWNLYGPTEATVWATGQLLSASVPGQPEALRTSSAPIGSALANMTTIVVDRTGREVPDGSQGELWIGGRGVARGYCNNPPLTRERFVHGPGGQRFYRTGDLVSMDNGVLHYFGRNDDQLQIHGVRVEPGDVEVTIEEHAAVARAAATWFETPDNERALGVAVVLRAGISLSVETLRQDLAQLLPKEMVPARLMLVDSIPLSPSGKVARGAIRAGLSRPDNVGGPVRSVPQLTATTGAVLGAFEAVLGMTGLGPDSLFLNLGGDSIAAFRVILEIEDRLGFTPNPVDLFEYSIAELATRLDATSTLGL